MKEKILIAFVILALSTCLLAQETGTIDSGEASTVQSIPNNSRESGARPNRPDGQRQRGPMGFRGFAPNMMGDINQMKSDLNLSDDQVKQINTLMEKYREINQKLIEETRNIMPQFNPNSPTDPNSPEARAMMENMQKNQQIMQNNALEYEKELKAILTKEQLEKYDSGKIKNILISNLEMSEENIYGQLSLNDDQKADFNNLLSKAIKDFYANQTKQTEKLNAFYTGQAKDIEANQEKINEQQTKNGTVNFMDFLSDETKKSYEEARTFGEENLKIANTFKEDFQKMLNSEQTAKYNKILAENSKRRVFFGNGQMPSRERTNDNRQNRGNRPDRAN